MDYCIAAADSPFAPRRVARVFRRGPSIHAAAPKLTSNHIHRSRPSSAQHVASTVAGELPFQLRSVRLVLRASTKDDTALLETALVLGSAILGNAGANQ